MTVNEIADMAGVSPDTVRREIAKQFPVLLVHGKKTVLTRAQAIPIMEALRKTGFIGLPQDAGQLPQDAGLDKIERLEAMVERLCVTVASLIPGQAEKPQAKIEAPAYYTVVGYANLKGRRLEKAESQALGREAKKICAERGQSIKFIPDTSWGSINAYPESVLAEVFA